MFDTITLSTVPRGAPFLAGYVDGRWPTYFSLVRLSWRPAVKGIAVFSSGRASCGDFEPGDMAPWQAPGWWRAERAASFARPCIYSSYWEFVNQVIPALSRAGIPRSAYWAWDANYTYRQHLDLGFDATQWNDRAYGLNLDESTATLAFLGVPAPPPPDPRHYAWFAVGPYQSRQFGKLNERNVVLHYDGARQHPVKYRNYLGLLRAELRWLASRDAYLSLRDKPPSWGLYHRGFRFQELTARANGRRFA